MLNANHPDDERLSALASGDTDATADFSLTEHLTTCDRCTDLVNELGVLRASLAELPDLQPSRPLRSLPEVTERPVGVDRLGGWARRFFAPTITAGAALALVGLVGTAAPALDGMALSGGQDAGSAPTTMELGEAADAEASAADTPAAEGGAVERATAESADHADSLFEGTASAAPEDGDVNAFEDSDEGRDRLTQVPAERSPWPMLLFTGVAVMIAAALLRWILVPRAG